MGAYGGGTQRGRTGDVSRDRAYSSCLGLSCERDVAPGGWVVWAEFQRQETPICLNTDKRDAV